MNSVTGPRKARCCRPTDKANGKLLGSIEVERTLHGSPMTFMHDGRQFIVITAGGAGELPEMLAFALPQSDS